MSNTRSIGFSYHMGWTCCAVVDADETGLRRVVTGRFNTGDEADRESREPYHVAGGWQGLERVPVPDNPATIVKRGLRAQRRHTRKNLKIFLQDKTVYRAGILVGRGSKAATIEQAINSHPQIHMAESHAVCDAIATALESLSITVHRVDRKTMFAQAASELGIEKENIMQLLASITPVQGPWRQEEKYCAIAAWLAAVRR